MYHPNPNSPYRVKFDFRVDFENGGHVQGHDFLLDLEGSAVDEATLKQMVVDSMNLARSGPVTIFRQQVVRRGQHDDAAPAAPPPDPAAVFAARIHAIAPDLSVETAVFNGEGLMNDVVIVNDRLVFRFAKSERGRAALAGELKVLDAVRPRLALSIPNPFYTSRDAVAYELLRGETLSRELLLSLPPATQQAVADQLGGFLRALHTTPPEAGLPLTLAPVRFDQWVELRRKVEASVYPLLLPHQVIWANRLFDGMLADPRGFDYEPRLMHGDLGPYHILFDRTAGRLNGIIDFGVAGLGDPAGDLGALLQIYGETFVRRLLAAYPEARALLPRARFYAQAIELQWAMLGLAQGETFWFTAHLGGARDIFGDEEPK